MAEMGMLDMLKQAHSLKKQMDEIQKKVAARKVTATSGGGMVTVEMTGKMVITGVHIEPSLVERGDARMLQELVKSAVNSAITKAQDLMAEEMKQVAGGMKIPGLG